ncbi:MAG: nucleotide exchange factor GrpE [Lachnospiraceae bacterium]|nr:nucleotide exchange factor GrpE [Lachnospiraceae bacterium]
MTEETVEASCETEENEAPEAAQAEGEVQEEVNAADENEAADEAEEPLSRRDKKAMAKKDDQIADLTDRLKRSMAEFDNYRKRTDKEKAAMYGMGLKDVVEKILPVVDNFERGLATVPEDKQEDAFVTGMTAVYKQFMTVLDGMGVKPIEAVGNEFDPNLHNAVMHTEDESVGENIVVEEFQKGYIYGDSVIRHSMVKVAN